jgi:hypothetical protein
MIHVAFNGAVYGVYLVYGVFISGSQIERKWVVSSSAVSQDHDRQAFYIYSSAKNWYDANSL